jgi:L-alanine-DL-glutamate epimerase-like enolase superfamily enzyme
MDHSIRHIRIFKMDIPLKFPFVISLETITSAKNVLIEMETHSGLIGYGECSPYEKIHKETQSSCLQVAKRIAPRLIGVHPCDISTWQKKINHDLAGQYCIKSAFDMALYDLSAQIAGLPLYAYLGGNNNKLMFTDMTVGIDSPENMAVAAKNYRDDAFPAIKIKLGTNRNDDVRRVKSIREAIGYDLPLRIDANQGWDKNTALEILMELVPYHVEYCEQPVQAENMEDMAYLHKHSPIPIMADESLFDPKDALELIRKNACSGFNIKLSKAGGIRPAQLSALFAQTAEMKCQVGCFSESRLGITALAHFALAHDAIVHFDMDSPFMLSLDPIVGGINYTPEKQVVICSDPGIGCKPILNESCFEEIV